jgi:type IV secretory pathway TrbD component
MELIKSWVKPAFFVILWITVLSYTISMVATVEPTLRVVGRQT